MSRNNESLATLGFEGMAAVAVRCAPWAAVLAAGSWLLLPEPAAAATISTCELSTSNTQCAITGQSGTGASSTAYFQIPILANSVGTGLIEPFLTTQDQPNPDGQESGFSSDEPDQFYKSGANEIGLESKRFGAPGPDGFTNSLTLGVIPRVEFNGALYREFLLDINQESTDPYLSLDVVRLFMGTTAIGAMADQYDRPPSGYDPRGMILENGVPLTLVWTMDFNGPNGTDNALLMDYRLCDGKKSEILECKNGSGRGYDVRMLIPDSVFGGYSPDAYFSMYTSFGWTACEQAPAERGSKGGKTSAKTENPCLRTFTTNDGFEEWAIRIFEQDDYCVLNPNDELCNPPDVPEPGTLALLGLGLIGVGLSRRRNAT